MLATISNAKAKTKKTMLRTNGTRTKAKAPLMTIKTNVKRLNPADKESKMIEPLTPLSLLRAFGTAINKRMRAASPKNDAMKMKMSNNGKAQIQRPLAIVPKATINEAKIKAMPAKALARIGLTFISPLNTLSVARARVVILIVTSRNILKNANIKIPYPAIPAKKL